MSLTAVARSNPCINLKQLAEICKQDEKAHDGGAMGPNTGAQAQKAGSSVCEGKGSTQPNSQEAGWGMSLSAHRLYISE